MRSVASTVCSVLGVPSPSSAETDPINEVIQSMGVVTRLIVVVIDAFGVSTWTAAGKLVKTFNSLARIHLVHVKSVMPTITPVNFATMVTGAHPNVHGIRDRREKINVETIFDILREADRVSAAAARAESSLGILISPHVDRQYIAGSNIDEEVCSLALEALEGMPDLLWVQLLDVDDAGHQHGPFSAESSAAAERDDRYLRKIVRAAKRNGYSIMVLADHGQHSVSHVDGRVSATHGTNSDDDAYVGFVWCTQRELQSLEI